MPLPAFFIALSALAFLLLWKAICFFLRAKRSRYMHSLNPTTDARLLCKLSNTVEFPFLANKGHEFALFRTFAIRCLNFIHGQYNISNADYLYTLSLFVLEPIRFSFKYGYRKWTEGEKQAQFVVWRDIGTRMGIRDIPVTVEEMERFNRQYEAQKMVYSDSNKVIGDATLDLLLSNAPAFLRPFGRRVVFALLDERLLDAMAYPRQPYWLVWTVQNMVRFCCGTLVRWFLPPRPLSWSMVRIPLEEGDENGDMVYRVRYDVYKPGTYPNGYRITELGNAKVGQVGEVGEVGEGGLLCHSHCEKKIN